MGLTKKYLKSKKVYKVTFTVPEGTVSGTDYIAIVGEFNNWDFNNAEMKKLKNGSFEKSFELKPGHTYQYRYMTADGRWFNDEAADAYWYESFAGTDNSVVDLTAQNGAEKPATKKVAKTQPKAKTTPATSKAKAATRKAKVATQSKTKTAPAAKAKSTTARTKATPKAAAAKATKKVGKPVTKKTSVKKSGKNDLLKIEGIGPKIAQILGDNGVSTFDVLATTPVKKLEAILKTAGPRYTMHKPTSWPKQAKLAADAKWDELAKLQQKLNGGK